jgi:nucleoside-diphosphate-sugar epimerase
VTRTHHGRCDKEQAMRVLVVGASGAIGARLVSQLRQRGHEVTGSSRSPGKAGRLRALGAEPIVLDALDAAAVRRAVAAARPDAMIYQATSLADAGFGRNLDRSFAKTNRLQTEGTDILLAAARETGVRRLPICSAFPTARAHRAGAAPRRLPDRSSAATAMTPDFAAAPPATAG